MGNGDVLPMPPDEFWEWFDARAHELKLNDSGVAKKAGISRSVISKARSKEKPIGHEAMVKIALALDTSLDFVFGLATLVPKKSKLEPDPEWMGLIDGETLDTVREWKAAIKAMREERRRIKK